MPPRSKSKVQPYNATILAVLRTYVYDHNRDWDLYTDVLAYPNTRYKVVLHPKPQTKKEVEPILNLTGIDDKHIAVTDRMRRQYEAYCRR